MPISTNVQATGSGLTLSSSENLTPSDFQYIAGLVQQHAAIEVGPEKQYLVEQRLSMVARAENAGSIAALIAQTRRDGTGRLAKMVVDAMTTNETSFFRDPTVFEFLRTQILPEVIERCRPQRELRIWCAAASSGQEPYSIVMMLKEHFPEVATSWRLRLLATDISPTMLERTRDGRYTRIEVNRGLPAALLVKHFQRAGLDWQINDDIRRVVDTRELNLSRPFPLAERFDLIFLRNVLIYFSVDTKRGVLDRVRRVLAPGGYLFLGSTESTMHVDDTWVRRAHGNVSCYQAEGPGPGPEEARPR